MKKDLIIIVLIILVIYLAYQQQGTNQSANIIESPNTQQLRSEINHYQKLYEQRVEKDVGDEEKISELEEQITLLEAIINKPTSEIGTQTDLNKEEFINLKGQTEYYKLLVHQSSKDAVKLENQLKLTEKVLSLSQEEETKTKNLLEIQQQETKEQLRKINLLFDDKVQDDEVINFNCLYALLQQIAEREQIKITDNEANNFAPLSHKDKRKLKKKK